MIFVTGGTGFIGQALIRHLVEAGHRVRMLIRPSHQTPKLPVGIPVEIAVTSIQDENGLRAAMAGVDTVYHLAGVERRGVSENLLAIDIRGTRAVLEAAVGAGAKRFFFTSHLGADRASAFPVLKTKAISEEYIRRSGLDFTIMRTAIVFGPNDGFTTGLAQLIKGFPLAFFTPGDGQTLIQPLWVEDLATCLTWALDDEQTRNRVYEIGGPEFLTLQQVVSTVMSKIGTRRPFVHISPPALRIITVILEYFLPASPVSVYWLDYLAANRTCALDTIPRSFNLMPARFSKRLDYLTGQNWWREMWRSVLRRPVA